ncbi:MAG: PorV/PorQ family protein [Elusimicrobiota bacterium]
MIIKNIFIILVIAFTVNSTILAAGIGTTGSQFLKIIPGVRPSGMGNSFTAVSDDVNSINYNPAGLGFLKGTEISLMHNQWVEEIKIEHFASGFHIRGFGTLGLTATTLASGNIKAYDNTGRDLNINYTTSDMSAGLAYASVLGNNFSMGLMVKSIQQKMEQENASTHGYDVGILYRGITKASVGLSAQNFGTGTRFRNETNPLPTIVRFGLSYEASRTFTIVFDARNPSDTQMNFGAGVEQKISLSGQSGLCLRAGYDTTTSASKLGGTAGASVGFGFAGKSFNVDFSWAPYGNVFGDTYRAGITLKFGEKDKEVLSTGENIQQQTKTPVVQNQQLSINISTNAQQNVIQQSTATLKEIEKPPVSNKLEGYVISGKVSKPDKTSLPGTIIKISQNGKEILRTMTDNNGKFKIKPLPGGMYNVKAWKQGFQAKEIPVSILNQTPESIEFILNR